MRSALVTARIAVAVAIALGLAGCALEKQREQVRQGFLTRGIHREAFLEEWGQPTRTWSVPSPDPVFRAEPFNTTWQRVIYEVWEYPSHATCLTFDGVRLVYWENGKTDCTPAPPRPSGAEPAPPYPPGP